MSVRVLHGDCRAILPTLPAASVHCVVTSPPYWGLRDYGVEGQLGLELTPEAYVAAMVGVFREVRRVLRDDGTLFCNMGDSFDDKQLVGMPWRLAFALQADGWFLRADIIWAKPNPMPESVTDRPTKAHEYIFLLSKAARYFYDADAVREPMTEAPEAILARVRRAQRGTARGGADVDKLERWSIREAYVPAGRNLRSVWTIPSAPFPDAHFATFPPALASRCIQAGTSERGCCAACGAPWARQVEVSGGTIGKSWHDHANDLARGHHASGPGWRDAAAGWERDYRRTEKGWQPSCACDAPVMPCTVLDCFGGSGTVGAVAEQLGRHSILIELSAAYVRMAEERTAQMGLFAQAPQAVAG
jgi:DNA modification methylase